VPIAISGDVDSALAAAFARSGGTPHLAVVPQGPYVLPTVGGKRYSLGQAWRCAA
jgi:hypothetical protein